LVKWETEFFTFWQNFLARIWLNKWEGCNFYVKDDLGRQKILLVFCILYSPLPPPPPPLPKTASAPKPFQTTTPISTDWKKTRKLSSNWTYFNFCFLQIFKYKYLGDDTLFWGSVLYPAQSTVHIFGSLPMPQGADLLPLPLHVAKEGRNHLKEEITPLLPTGIGDRYSQTISNLGNAALLRRCEVPF
jgi:hypothetical protein